MLFNGLTHVGQKKIHVRIMRLMFLLNSQSFHFCSYCCLPFHGSFITQREGNRGTKPPRRISNIFIRSGDIRRRTSKSSEIGPNFACFWPLKFFLERAPEILDRHYKLWPSTD